RAISGAKKSPAARLAVRPPFSLIRRSDTSASNPEKTLRSRRWAAPVRGVGWGRLAVLESGLVDASLLSVPENIIAAQKGYHELIFLGDIVTFPQNGFGTSVQRIQQQPDEVYRMVRATLRGLAFVMDDASRDQAREIMMKQWRVSDAKLADEMLRYLK